MVTEATVLRCQKVSSLIYWEEWSYKKNGKGKCFDIDLWKILAYNLLKGRFFEDPHLIYTTFGKRLVTKPMALSTAFI
jgi:hypothetical protein